VMTAPSKRIVELAKDYEKPLHGSLVALETSLSAIRAECQLFHAWIIVDWNCSADLTGPENSDFTSVKEQVA
jgi:hypothetical protein